MSERILPKMPRGRGRYPKPAEVVDEQLAAVGSIAQLEGLDDHTGAQRRRLHLAGRGGMRTLDYGGES